VSESHACSRNLVHLGMSSGDEDEKEDDGFNPTPGPKATRPAIPVTESNDVHCIQTLIILRANQTATKTLHGGQRGHGQTSLMSSLPASVWTGVLFPYMKWSGCVR
jgi:hypothetical protein